MSLLPKALLDETINTYSCVAVLVKFEVKDDLGRETTVCPTSVPVSTIFHFLFPEIKEVVRPPKFTLVVVPEEAKEPLLHPHTK
ncbi:hypothetical protein D3C86_1239550 [compost metagenome]